MIFLVTKNLKSTNCLLHSDPKGNLEYSKKYGLCAGICSVFYLVFFFIWKVYIIHQTTIMSGLAFKEPILLPWLYYNSTPFNNTAFLDCINKYFFKNY
jgi:hypothetical protein